VTGAFAGRDGSDAESIVTDRYLEALLAAHARGVDRGPVPVEPPTAIRRAADRLARDLPRLHPSFRFEEALASRLADVAEGLRLPVAVGGERVVLPLAGGGGRLSPAELAALLPTAEPGAAGDDQDRSGLGRPLLIGGALTSAALSLAGAAYVAWRLNRPPASPMARAARAVARTRPV
jgi:hypothetical protein